MSTNVKTGLPQDIAKAGAESWNKDWKSLKETGRQKIQHQRATGEAKQAEVQHANAKAQQQANLHDGSVKAEQPRVGQRTDTASKQPSQASETSTTQTKGDTAKSGFEQQSEIRADKQLSKFQQSRAHVKSPSTPKGQDAHQARSGATAKSNTASSPRAAVPTDSAAAAARGQATVAKTGIPFPPAAAKQSGASEKATAQQKTAQGKQATKGQRSAAKGQAKKASATVEPNTEQVAKQERAKQSSTPERDASRAHDERGTDLAQSNAHDTHAAAHVAIAGAGSQGEPQRKESQKEQALRTESAKKATSPEETPEAVQQIAAANAHASRGQRKADGEPLSELPDGDVASDTESLYTSDAEWKSTIIGQPDTSSLTQAFARHAERLLNRQVLKQPQLQALTDLAQEAQQYLEKRPLSERVQSTNPKDRDQIALGTIQNSVYGKGVVA